MITLFGNVMLHLSNKERRYGFRTDTAAIREWIISTWIPLSFRLKIWHKRRSKELEHKGPEVSLRQMFR